MRSRASACSGNCPSTGRSPRLPACFRPPSAPNALGKGLICPSSCGAEAAWAAADMTILAPQDLLQLINHFKGLQTLRRPEPTPDPGGEAMPDLKGIKGQETAKRALEGAPPGGPK